MREGIDNNQPAPVIRHSRESGNSGILKPDNGTRREYHCQHEIDKGK